MCISPICGQPIAVPEGAVQVVCGACNTLHFVSDSDLIDSNKKNEDLNSFDFESSADMDLSDLDLEAVLENNDSVDTLDSDELDELPPALQEENTEPEVETAPIEPKNEKHIPDQEVGFLVTSTGEYLPLKLGVNIIGRLNADLVISDKTVSRKHCAIEVSADESSNLTFVIYDIGHTDGTPSTNGVYLSGRTIRLQDYERVPLKDGVTIEVGSVHLDFLVKAKSIPD